MGPRRRVWRLSVLPWLSAACVLLVLVWCPPALAHANLLGSSPPAGGKLSESPEQVRLRFSEPVDAEFGPIEVRDEDGERVDEDDARVDPRDARVVVANLPGPLPEGSYQVEWRVTSVDGHVVEGRYEFAVAPRKKVQPKDKPVANEQGDEGNTGGGPAGQEASREGPAPVLAYSVLSLGALAGIVVAALAVSSLARRNKR